jgi:DNA repair exonuclease SbcCD ATPase subunit
MKTTKKRPPEPPSSRITEKLLSEREKLGRRRESNTPVVKPSPGGGASGSQGEAQTRHAEERAALLGLRIQQLALEKEQVEQERDKHASLADFGQQEFIASERTAKHQAEQIVILKQNLEELEWRMKNSQEEFEQDEQRLHSDAEALREQLAELRATMSPTTDDDGAFAVTEIKDIKDQITKVRKERTAAQRDLADVAQLKNTEIDAVRDKLSALQNRCRREANERDGQIGDARQKIHEMAMQIARKEAKLQELHAVLEDERKKHDRQLSKANEALASQVARMKALAQQRESEALRLQERLDVCETALQDKKGELKSALSFLNAIREQATDRGSKTAPSTEYGEDWAGDTADA